MLYEFYSERLVKMLLLSNQKDGYLFKINSINMPYSKKLKLLGLGIHTGLIAWVLRNHGGDMVLALGNARVSIGKTMANLITVSIL
jgi:Fe2+ transport system protein FeoA